MATAPSLCVLRYFNSWNKNLRKEGLCSVLLRTSSLFGRHYCSSNFLVAAACATALRSPDLVALEYADLNLTHKVSEELGHVRIRQHVNPLSASFSVCNSLGLLFLSQILQGEDEMATAPSLCVLRYFNSWNKNLRKEGLCSVLLRTSSLFGRHYCSSNFLVGAACATALRSPDLVALEYADLNLTHKVSEELGHVRIRQHVNPLSASFSVVADFSYGLRKEILKRKIIWGWKYGRKYGNQLLILLFICFRLVKRANFWVKELALSNMYGPETLFCTVKTRNQLHFLFANATISFNQLVSTYPGPLMLVSILCPDPHFKKRHHKRRVVQKHLVDSIIKNLMHGGQVFIQSDVLEVALDMRNQFDADVDVLHHIDALSQSVLCDNEGWLLSNPMGIRTEREIHAELEGARIFRRLYQKMA
ncbi:trna (guanine-n(7)-)-methyltransferase [Quercus suber]|uniref:tRNA (guanine(46)-N(7))-methyltransferase n=1 Tax=Quercus suber TaxID=58331 RepID=A0AAW0KAU4_QUESU